MFSGRHALLTVLGAATRCDRDGCRVEDLVFSVSEGFRVLVLVGEFKVRSSGCSLFTGL